MIKRCVLGRDAERSVLLQRSQRFEESCTIFSAWVTESAGKKVAEGSESWEIHWRRFVDSRIPRTCSQTSFSHRSNHGFQQGSELVLAWPQSYVTRRNATPSQAQASVVSTQDLRQRFHRRRRCRRSGFALLFQEDGVGRQPSDAVLRRRSHPPLYDASSSHPQKARIRYGFHEYCLVRRSRVHRLRFGREVRRRPHALSLSSWVLCWVSHFYSQYSG